MEEREWPNEKDTEERTPTAPGESPESDERTAGGVDPLTGEPGKPESSNADIPAAG